jgi:hypothetical protein
MSEPAMAEFGIWGDTDPDKHLAWLKENCADRKEEDMFRACSVCGREGVMLDSLGPDCSAICPEDMRCWVVGSGLFSAWDLAPMAIKERDREILRRCVPDDDVSARCIPKRRA